MLMALAMLCLSCTDSSNDSPWGEQDAATVVARYDGQWKVDGHDAGTGEMGLYTTGFALSDIPFEAVLKLAFPDRSVTCSNGNGYVVPYDNIGQTQQAVYMRLGASRWRTDAVIDGTRYAAVLCMATDIGQTAVWPNATLSKVSGVYSMAFPVCKVELYDADGTLCDTASAGWQITFTTLSRKK